MAPCRLLARLVRPAQGGSCRRSRSYELTRCLQSDDDRVAMMAAQAILDRGYGKPTQSIDANINDNPVRYIVELPVKDKTTEEWLKGNAAYLASTKRAFEA